MYYVYVYVFGWGYVYVYVFGWGDVEVCVCVNVDIDICISTSNIFDITHWHTRTSYRTTNISQLRKHTAHTDTHTQIHTHTRDKHTFKTTAPNRATHTQGTTTQPICRLDLYINQRTPKPPKARKPQTFQPSHSYMIPQPWTPFNPERPEAFNSKAIGPGLLYLEGFLERRRVLPWERGEVCVCVLCAWTTRGLPWEKETFTWRGCSEHV